MLTRFLVFLCALSPRLRRALWRWWYDKLAKQIEAAQWTFMNYGFQPTAGTAGLALKTEDEPDRLCIQLYERVTRSINLSGAKVLEVGSGRGGGASYVARYRQAGFGSMLGVDYSREAVLFCKSRHADIANLDFEFGDAENLFLPAGAFDAVINVESSHCYGNIRKFFSEVARVLRPGGYFLYADLREPAEVETLRGQLRSTAGLELLEEEDITAGVAAALQADDARKRAMIQSIIPASIRPLFEEFAGIQSGQISKRLKDGTLAYSRYVVRKTGSDPG